MDYQGPRRVNLVEFVLEGRAQVWFDSLRMSRPEDAAPIAWGEFEERFTREFLPESVRQKRAYEFERLTYATCGTIDEYASRFLELSMYAPGLVTTEQQRIDRFIYGLPTDIHNNLVGQPHVSLTDVIDRARRIEERNKEVRAADGEARKKFRTDVPQFNQRGGFFQQPQGGNRGHVQGARPVMVQQGQVQTVQRIPYCTLCNRRHFGDCTQTQCFHCRRPGHIRSQCPLLQGIARPIAAHAPLRPPALPAAQQGQIGRGKGVPV